MSKLGHRFTKEAFKGFHKRPGRAPHESEVVAHAVLMDDWGGAVICVNGLRQAYELGQGTVGAPFELVQYMLENQDVECDLEGDPIPAKS